MKNIVGPQIPGGRSPQHLVDELGGDTEGGPLPRQVVAGDGRAGGHVTSQYEAAAGVAAGRGLVRQGVAAEGAQAGEERIHPPLEVQQIILVHRVVVVVPRQGFIVGEVLLQHRRAQRHGRLQDRHIPRQRMVAVPRNGPGETRAEVQDHPQVRVRVRRRVVEDAVEEAERIAVAFDLLDGPEDLVHVRRAGREQDRFPEAAHVLDEGVISEIGGTDLEDAHQIVQEGSALHVEGRGHELDPDFVAVHLQRLVFLLPEAVVLLEEFVLARGRFLAQVPVAGALLGGNRIGLVGLEFDGLGAPGGRLVDEASGQVHGPLVVDAGFGDDVGAVDDVGSVVEVRDVVGEAHARSMVCLMRRRTLSSPARMSWLSISSAM